MSSDEDIAEAIAKTRAICCADPSRISDPTLPIYVLHASDVLEQEHARFEQGEPMALLAAIRVCANHDLPLPPWASKAFISRYDQVLNCRSGSWDEVFGRPYEKGKHLDRLRQARQLQFKVWFRINEAHESGMSINRQLFELVGRDLGIGRTRAEELYALEKRKLGRPAKTRKLPGLPEPK